MKGQERGGMVRGPTGLTRLRLWERLRDAILVAGAILLGLLFRFEGRIPEYFVRRGAFVALGTAVALVILGHLRGIYRSLPRYASLGEILRIAEVVAVTHVALVGVILIVDGPVRLLPISVPLISAPIVFVLLGLCRVWRRLVPYLRTRRASRADAQRAIIIGAGDAGERVVRQMLAEGQVVPVGFLDDELGKFGRRLHGIPIVGGIGELPSVLPVMQATLVIIAVSNPPGDLVSRIVAMASSSGASVKIAPELSVIAELGASTKVRDIAVEDLIGRQPVSIDVVETASYLRDRSVLITGAAGSIGSELARQAMGFLPRSLTILDINETDLFMLREELVAINPEQAQRVSFVLADVRDRGRVDEVLAQHAPDVVFHAAALKHVPIGEAEPAETIRTNVFGTRNMVAAASEHGIERFILVSTDKAVRPKNVMGATKRLAELIVMEASARNGTHFASVRFGNVLGSRGSVVPIFERQIERGWPIVVTDPEATRYFMTIEEASSLILQAGAWADSGGISVLDMGRPVRIVDLAERMRDLLSARGATPSAIVYSGLRAGEKLHEQLNDHNEALQPSAHPLISTVPRMTVPRDLGDLIDELERSIVQGEDPAKLRHVLLGIVANGDPAMDEVARKRNG